MCIDVLGSAFNPLLKSSVLQRRCIYQFIYIFQTDFSVYLCMLMVGIVAGICVRVPWLSSVAVCLQEVAKC